MSRFTEALAAARDYVGINRATTPRSSSRSRRSAARLNSRTVHRESPSRGEIRKYWRQYRSVPLLRAPVNQFADDVMAPGYRIEADSDDTAEYLREWAESAAVLNGERNRDLGDLLHRIPIQSKVKGTCLIEHAPLADAPDAIGGLSLIPPETVTWYSRSGNNLLLQPGDTDHDEAKLTEDGQAAAYVQYDRGNYSGAKDETRLTVDDVTKIVNDPDAADVFGNSAIEPVSPRVEAIREKLQNHDTAIESKAWGQWFFEFQKEEYDDQIVEWDEKSKDDVMDAVEGMGPGDQVSIDGPIEIENIPGEVGDILGTLEFEVDWILAAMPAPLYATGFADKVNQFVVDGQETRHDRRVERFRGIIEQAITPVLRQVAEQAGKDPSGVGLHLEPPEEKSPVLSLSDEEMNRLSQWADAAEKVSGTEEPATLVDDETLRELILQLPEDSAPTDVDPADEVPPMPEPDDVGDESEA